MKRKILLMLLLACIITSIIIYQIRTKPIVIVYDNVKIYSKDIKTLADNNHISFEEALNLQINNLIEMKEIDKYNICIKDEYIEGLVSELEEHEPELYSAIVKKMTLEEYKKNLKEHHMRMELFDTITKDYIGTIDISDESLKDWLNDNGILNYTEEEFANLKDKIAEKMVAEKSKEYYNKWIANERNTHSKKI